VSFLKDIATHLFVKSMVKIYSKRRIVMGLRHRLKRCTATKYGLIIAILPIISSAGQSKSAKSFQEAISDGQTKLSFRYRYEGVEQANSLNDANASTLKSRINYSSKRYLNFKIGVEIDDVTAIGEENYNDTRNGNTNRSVVADPEGTEVNQAWLSYNGISDTTLKYGRQRINLDNQRFIGGVGWRQNEQTYDGFTLKNTSFRDTTINYAYIDNINRIFGPDDGNPVADIDTRTHLLNLKYSGWDLGEISIYGYLIDMLDAPVLSSETYGVRFSGARKFGATSKLLYAIEYATQEDYGNHASQNEYDADYLDVVLGLKLDANTVKFGYEVLEGDASQSGQFFRTPLATLHKFNGWADQFLATPGAGLEDTYLSLSRVWSNYKLIAVFHKFGAEDGSDDYGDEIDLALTRALNKNVSIQLKYADYNAGSGASVLGKVDTEKLWFSVNLKF